MKHGGALSNIVKHLPEQLSASAFIDAMFDEVVLLDRDGIIVAANAAWNQFCKENNGDVSLCYRGANYLDICREAVGASSAEASLIPKGFEETLQTGVTNGPRTSWRPGSGVLRAIRCVLPRPMR